MGVNLPGRPSTRLYGIVYFIYFNIYPVGHLRGPTRIDYIIYFNIHRTTSYAHTVLILLSPYQDQYYLRASVQAYLPGVQDPYYPTQDPSSSESCIAESCIAESCTAESCTAGTSLRVGYEPTYKSTHLRYIYLLHIILRCTPTGTTLSYHK